MVVDATVKPHVVVLSSPGMGHVTPMLELAKRLVLHHSCNVTFLNITTEASPTQTHFLHSSNNFPPGLTVVDFPRADVSAVISGDTPQLAHLCISVREGLHSLKATLLQLQKPQALITELFCTQALETCKELSIPAYVLCTTSTLFLAMSLFCRELDRDLSGEFLEVPGCEPIAQIRTEDLPFNYSYSNEWHHYHFCRVPTAVGIFVNTWEDLEAVPLRAFREHPFYKEIQMPPVFPIGPLVKETEPVNGRGEECMAWLDKQPTGSVLFAALGSGGTLCAEQLAELAWGLEQSQQRFLWVVRAPTNVSGLGNYFNVGADVNDPKTYLPEGFLERTGELGMVVPSWAPQMLVLRHHSVAAFLSHCGWNSVLESVTHGVPMITLPLGADQNMNATMVAEDIGVAMKPEVEQRSRVVGRAEIERVVRATMEGEEGKAMRERVRDLRETALKAANCGGKSYEALASLANQWKAMCVEK